MSAANVALSSGSRVIAFIDPLKSSEYVLGIPVLADFHAVDNWSKCQFFIAVGDNYSRESIYTRLTAKYGALRFATLVHPTASISIDTEIGIGSVVMPNATVGPSTMIGEFCIINSNASIDHECRMQNFSSLAPSATTGGRVTIGRRSAISLGAAIQQGICIGDDSILGANSFLNKNLAKNTLAYGSPAIPIRTRLSNETYLK